MTSNGCASSTLAGGTTDKSVIVADLTDKTEATAIVGTVKNPMIKRLINYLLQRVRIRLTSSIFEIIKQLNIMTLIILLIVLIACAIFITIFISIKANKIAKIYENSVYTSDADLNKPTFIRVNDDEGLDYIFNTIDISVITIIDCLNRKENKYLLRICLKDYSKVTDTIDITFAYNNKIVRDQIYNALSDYNISDKLN